MVAGSVIWNTLTEAVLTSALSDVELQWKAFVRRTDLTLQTHAGALIMSLPRGKALMCLHTARLETGLKLAPVISPKNPCGVLE